MKNTTRHLAALCATVAALASYGTADYNWTGGTGDGNVLTAGNWDIEDSLPGAEDNARIGTLPAATLSGTVTWYRLYLGTESGKTGEFNLAGGGTLNVPWLLMFAAVDNASGVLNINEGANVTAKAISTLDHTGTNTFNLAGGTLTVEDYVDWGRNASAVSTFNQSGGTFNLRNAVMQLGREAKGTGTYNFTGGTLAATGGKDFIMGSEATSTGRFLISGDATANLGSSKIFAGGCKNDAGGKASQGIVKQSGGTIATTGNVYVGYYGAGEWVQTGGSTSAGDLRLAENGGTGFYSLCGGSAAAKRILLARNGGKGRAQLIKGTFKSSAGTDPFLSLGANSHGYATLGSDFTLDTSDVDTTFAADGVKVFAAAGSSLTKAGEGKLTMGAPLADNLSVAKGTLALSSGAAAIPTLAHRWKMNGDMTDCVGGADGKLVGNASWLNSNTGINLPGGAKGKGGHASLGKGVFAGDEATLEIWARRKGIKNWSRVFECRSDDNSAILMMSWCQGTDGTKAKVSAYSGGKEATASPAIDGNAGYHISVRFKKNADGTTTITWARRTLSTGDADISVLSTVDTVYDNGGEGWSFDHLANAELTLGYSPHYDDYDAEAVYLDVRIWHGALSDAALDLSAKYGAEATDEQIAEVQALSAQTVTRERRISIADGAILDLGGNTLTCATLSCGGTIVNGKLVVTKGLEVAPGRTLTVASGAELDVSAVTDVALDGSASLDGRGWNAIVSDGAGALDLPDVSLRPAGLPGWKVSFDDGKVRIGPCGLMIMLK